MCGICGIVYSEIAAPVELPRLIAMRDIMVRRGPDDAGSYHSSGVMLGSRRLAILDLSAEGHMPMHTSDGRFWIAYNGESFNFRDLRIWLEGKGYRFRSKTDTEVVVNLYAHEGAAMLQRLNGMFSIAIWDSLEHSLFLARDRLGVKPLYYAEEHGALYFASEQKALFAAGIKCEFDTATWEELLCFRYTAGERTPLIGIRRLLPGHYLEWKAGEARIKRWWSLIERTNVLRSAPPSNPVKWFHETFDNSVKLRQISDVPLGVLLSGGLDSSCVAASLHAQGATDVASFTVRFNENYYDEGPQAQSLAKKCGLRHHELVLDQGKLFALLHHCSWLNDEPLVHGNDLHLFAIAKYAKPEVSVLLSGEGADETLGGYVRYRPLRFLGALTYLRRLIATGCKFVPNGSPGSIIRRLHKLNRFLGLGVGDNFVLFNACDILPVDLAVLGFKPADDFLYRREILIEANRLYPGEPMRRAMYLDQHTFLCSILDRNDRTTMGASIECRVPFLDYRLVEGLSALPSSVLFRGHESKALLRNAFAERLPAMIRSYRKWGFGVPWHEYFKQNSEFRDIIATLADESPVVDGPFDRLKVKKVTDSYLRGDLSNHAIVQQLLFISVWYRTCVNVKTNFRAMPDFGVAV